MSTPPDDRNEMLGELFGSVYGLADEFAWRIGPDEVEARLRRVLRQAARTARAGRAGQARGAVPAVGELPVIRLVSLVAVGEQDAWNEIIERYAPLVYAICRRHHLVDHDAEDVGQRVWALLAGMIGSLRQPEALAGLLATLTERECLRLRRRARPLAGRQEDQELPGDDPAIEEEILAAERDTALRAAVAGLPPRCQQLLAMLIHDPPYSYQEISAKLGIPVGSIGPQRTRCMDWLRQSMALGPAGDDFPVRDDRPRPKPRPAP